ncbi:Hypothetical protein AA314_00436 [Archangium gephyra]|uniref:Uncharacterized protein n=1 Tax=Archangium gephyra TaxID=48 RepID=A0AAC8Q0M6_9BACT|nr:Hypothetical protein AA314_00436 [Archangium gephyra]
MSVYGEGLLLTASRDDARARSPPVPPGAQGGQTSAASHSPGPPPARGLPPGNTDCPWMDGYPVEAGLPEDFWRRGAPARAGDAYS